MPKFTSEFTSVTSEFTRVPPRLVTTAEDHVRSLTIQDDKQRTITSYFAEQQRKEQQLKKERERKRLEEVEKQMLERQRRKASPPAEAECHDIERMQPIYQPRPLTPPSQPERKFTTIQEALNVEPPELEDTEMMDASSTTAP
ncbi:hypothetical protein ABG067_009138, partial [Albugo candida]